MEKLIDRFLRYVAVDTQSDENSESQPSAAKELDLLRMLRDELEEMGVKAKLDEWGYVMATIPANVEDENVPSIGFIAHVDTSPDASGANIKPQIIEGYDGGDIPLRGVYCAQSVSLPIYQSTLANFKIALTTPISAPPAINPEAIRVPFS